MILNWRLVLLPTHLKVIIQNSFNFKTFSSLMMIVCNEVTYVYIFVKFQINLFHDMLHYPIKRKWCRLKTWLLWFVSLFEFHSATVQPPQHCQDLLSKPLLNLASNGLDASQLIVMCWADSRLFAKQAWRQGYLPFDVQQQDASHIEKSWVPACHYANQNV